MDIDKFEYTFWPKFKYGCQVINGSFPILEIRLKEILDINKRKYDESLDGQDKVSGEK